MKKKNYFLPKRLINNSILLFLLGNFAHAQNTSPWPSSGSIGIGTTTPISILHVNGNSVFASSTGVPTYAAFIKGSNNVSGPTTPEYTWYNNDQTGMFHPAVNVIGFSTYGAERMRITDNGIAIGTANAPLGRLEVVGGGTGKTNGLHLRNTDVSTVIYNLPTTNGGAIQVTSGSTSSTLGTSAYRLAIQPEGGCVSIGSATFDDNWKLSVAGKIRATEIKVYTGWYDFVFDKEYKLMPLKEVETYIKANKHLPEIPSAKEVEKEGVSLGEMQGRLLQKIEELTLHMIDQNKKLEALQLENEQIKKSITSSKK